VVFLAGERLQELPAGRPRSTRVHSRRRRIVIRRAGLLLTRQSRLGRRVYGGWLPQPPRRLPPGLHAEQSTQYWPGPERACTHMLMGMYPWVWLPQRCDRQRLRPLTAQHASVLLLKYFQVTSIKIGQLWHAPSPHASSHLVRSRLRTHRLEREKEPGLASRARNSCDDLGPVRHLR
jgi:hypothetical protein